MSRTEHRDTRRAPRSGRVARVLVVALLSPALALGLVGPPPLPAAANSSVSLAGSNAWIVTDFAADAANNGTLTPDDQRRLQGGATTAPKSKPGFKPRGPIGGILGAFNTLSMLGGFIPEWNPFGGDDPPTIPAPQGQPGGATVVGSPQAGYTTMPQGTMTLNAQGTATAYAFAAPRTQGYGGYCRQLFNLSTGADITPSPPANQLGQSTTGGTQTHLTYELRTDYYPRQSGTGICQSSPLVGQTWIPPGGGTAVGPNNAPATTPSTTPRYIDQKISCRTGTTGPVEVVSKRTGPFTFDPSQPAELPEVPDLSCPEGMWLESGETVLATESSPDTVPITSYEAPPWVERQVERFPECYPSTNQVCALSVSVRVQVGVGTNPDPGTDPEAERQWRRCDSYAPGASPCTDWNTDPRKTDRYRCQFGPYVVALRVCEPLERRYMTPPKIKPTPDTESNPDTEAPPEPKPDVTPDPTPDQTPDLGNCVPGWADLLTPWWVFKAIGCAFMWAFVPKTGLKERMAKIGAMVTGLPPFSWVDSIASIPDLIPNGDGNCPNWRIKIGPMDKNVVCGSSYTDAIRAGRPVFLAMMVTLAIWPLIRSTYYASIPILSPKPT